MLSWILHWGGSRCMNALTMMSRVTGIVAARAVWQAEGRFLRSRDVRRIPLVGPWLAENVTRWRDNSPRRRAGRAAARREKVRLTLLVAERLEPQSGV